MREDVALLQQELKTRFGLGRFFGLEDVVLILDSLLLLRLEGLGLGLGLGLQLGLGLGLGLASSRARLRTSARAVLVPCTILSCRLHTPAGVKAAASERKPPEPGEGEGEG